MKLITGILGFLIATSTGLQAEPVVRAANIAPDAIATSLMPVPIFPFAIHSVAFSPDGETLATGDGTGTVRLWNMRGGELKTTIQAHTNWAFSLAWSGGGKQLVTGGGDNLVHIFESSDPARPVKTLRGHVKDVHAVALTPDGTRIVSAGDDKHIIVWDVATGSEVRRWRAHDGPIPALAVNPDGRTIASGSRDDIIRLWDLGSGAMRDTLIGHGDDVLSIRFSPDGESLASASYDGTVRLWNVSSGKAIRILKGHTDRVFGVAFSPDGLRLASAGDSTLRIWNIADGTQLHALAFGGTIDAAGQRIDEHISAVAYSPDGALIGASSTTGSTALIDSHTGKVVRRLMAEQIAPR